MKVLYITTVSRTINAFLVPHIKMLLKNGYVVDCACSIDKHVDEGLIRDGVNIYDIPFCRNPLSLNNLKAFKELMKIQKKNNYDIVHVHTPVASIYGRLLKLRFRKLNTIYTAHGYHFLKKGPKIGWVLYYPIEKIMAKLTDITININKEDYEITKNRLKPKKCYLVNGVGLDLSKYKPLSEEEIYKKREELGIKKEDFIIIMIAELNRNKNQIQLIKAMELLKDIHPNVKALLVGEGEKLSELKEEVINKHLEDNVKFLGFRNDINELINISNIGVLLSYREGLPRNVMELIANNKKVIVTNIRGCRDIVTNENIGSLVEVGDYIGLYKIIEKFYNEDKKKYNVIEEIKLYDVNNINEVLLNIYKKL